MRPGHEADHSLPSSTEVKNRGGIPPLPHMSPWLLLLLLLPRYRPLSYSLLFCQYNVISTEDTNNVNSGKSRISNAGLSQATASPETLSLLLIVLKCPPPPAPMLSCNWQHLIHLITCLRTSMFPGEAADSQCGKGPLSDADVGWCPHPLSFHVTGCTGSMVNGVWTVGNMCDRKLRLLIDSTMNRFSCDECSCA
jgi:hypothetical protein